MMLPWLAVVFAGILGNGNPEADRISKEIASAVQEKADVTPVKLPAKKLAAIAHHASGVRDVVAKLGFDGLIGGELINKGGVLTLRLIVYAGDGGMRSLTEITLKNRALGLDDFAVIRQNLAEEAAALAPKTVAAPKVSPKAKPEPEPEIEMEATPPPAPKAAVKAPKPVAAPAPKAAPAAPLGADDEDPLAGPAKKAKPQASAAKAKPAPEPVIEMAPPTPAAPTEVAAADPAPAADDEVAVPTDTGVAASAEAEDEDPQLGLRVGVGLGVISRNFAPGPATVAGYSASPVGAISFAAQIQPAKRFCLDALVDRTLSMQTPMGNSMATTAMSRWEVSGDYTLHTGRFAVAGRLGLGRRAFSIESNIAGRTPDSDYNYLIVGATASAALGKKVTLRGTAAFEPVLWGAEPTEMAFGEARRWAIDVGAAFEVRVRDHIYARAAADLQRFAWNWTAAGDRGAGGAVDLFPSATASLGATY